MPEGARRPAFSRALSTSRECGTIVFFTLTWPFGLAKKTATPHSSDMLRSATLLALLLLPGLARAGKLEDSFSGKIVITKRRLSQHLTSGEIKGAQVASLWPEKSGEDKGKWRFEYLAFFAHPLMDLEVKLRFYDVTGGIRHFIAEASTFVQTRGERIFGSSQIIGAPEFEPNKKLLVTIESRGRVLAQTNLIIRGEGPHYSGRVEFSDEEAKQKDPGH